MTVGSSAILEPSQLVQLTGVAGSIPAELKELVSITTYGMLVGLDVASTATTVTLTSDTAVLEESLLELRTDIDNNTLELSTLDFSPYQLELSAGSGRGPVLPDPSGHDHPLAPGEWRHHTAWPRRAPANQG